MKRFRLYSDRTPLTSALKSFNLWIRPPHTKLLREVLFPVGPSSYPAHHLDLGASS